MLQHLEFSIEPAQAVMFSLSVLVCAIMFPALNMLRMMLCKIFVIVEILQKDQYQQQADLRALCVGLISNPVISSGDEIAMLCCTHLKYTAQ